MVHLANRLHLILTVHPNFRQHLSPRFNDIQVLDSHRYLTILIRSNQILSLLCTTHTSPHPWMAKTSHTVGMVVIENAEGPRA